MLLQFPFLPLDAGVGADRVIGAVAKAFLEHCAPVGLGEVLLSLFLRHARLY